MVRTTTIPLIPVSSSDRTNSHKKDPSLNNNSTAMITIQQQNNIKNAKINNMTPMINNNIALQPQTQREAIAKMENHATHNMIKPQNVKNSIANSTNNSVINKDKTNVENMALLENQTRDSARESVMKPPWDFNDKSQNETELKEVSHFCVFFFYV